MGANVFLARVLAVPNGMVGALAAAFDAEARGRHYAVVSVLALVYWACMLHGGGYYLGTDLTADILMPANAAMVWRSDLTLHADYHSPLGGLYFGHAAAAAWVSEWAIGEYSPLDVLTTMNVMAFLFSLGLMALMTRILKFSFPVWLSLVFMFCLFSGSIATGKYVGWNESYNQTLSVVFLAYALACIYAVYGSQRLFSPPRILSALAGVIVFGAALYKINFAFGLAGLHFATLLAIALGNRDEWRKIFFAGFGVFTAVVAVLFMATLLLGYDFAAYWQDLQAAAHVKSHRYLLVNKVWHLPESFMMAVLCWLAFSYFYRKDKEKPRLDVVSLLFWIGVWLAVWLCFVGAATEQDIRRFLTYAMLCIAFWYLRRALPSLVRSACAIGVILLLMKYPAYFTVQQLTLKINPSLAQSGEYYVSDTARFNYAAFSDIPEIFDKQFLSAEPPARASFQRMEYWTLSANDAMHIYRKLQRGDDAPAVAVMAFQNPLLFYADAVASPQLHWKDGFTNVTDFLMNKEIENNSYVLAPVHVDAMTQDFAACWFLRSDAAREFDLALTTDFWHLFVRRGAVQNAELSDAMQWRHVLSEPWFVRQCDEILRDKRGVRGRWFARFMARIQDNLFSPDV